MSGRDLQIKDYFRKRGKERELFSSTYHTTYIHMYLFIVHLIILYFIISVVVLGNQLSVSDLNCGRAGGNRLPWGRRLGLSLGKLSLGSL